MKNKITFIFLLMAFGANACAQLGAPKITVKDTMYIIQAVYNDTPLDEADWPATILVEDPVKIYIGGYTYTKGKSVDQATNEYNSSWDGFIDWFLYDAVCNGKKCHVMKIIPRDGCKKMQDKYPYRKYVIDDYSFYVVTENVYLTMLYDSLVK